MERFNYFWNYYVYNVIDIDTDETYETDDFDTAQRYYDLWHRKEPERRLIIQQIHSIARRIK